MKTVVGIDVGGSTTKIVGFDKDGHLIDPIFVRATDQITSIYGALGKFTTENNLTLSDIERIMVTGVGSTFMNTPIYNIPVQKMSEFSCVGRGGIWLSGLSEAIVVSMGTGTAIVHAKEDGFFEYLGGTGVGGGTLMGLSNSSSAFGTSTTSSSWHPKAISPKSICASATLRKKTYTPVFLPILQRQTSASSATSPLRATLRWVCST